jgi:YVTN family beta-propeller protein
VNTNALSIIDLTARQSWATVLLDHLMEGAADPWGVAISKDGGKLWVTLAGIHQVARVDLTTLHAFAEGKLPDDHRLSQVASYSPGTESIWFRIKKDVKQRSELVNDLAALYAADLIQRVPADGKGPRGASLSPDGATLAVAMYFSGEVVLIDAATLKTKARVSLGEQPPLDLVREGERMFFDASYCFQHWMSCSTCHPDTRVDGMNWDLLNDGLGNPKNTRSMLLSHLTPPSMTHGVRSSMAEAVKAGFIHIQFHQPEEATLKAVEAYLKALEPEPSPSLGKGGEPNDAAKRGKELFFSEKTQCATCHPAPLYTDLKTYDVGTRGEFDRVSEFDTPTLIEVYRTRPYLHDGSVASLREVLIERNKEDTHGITSKLSPAEIEDLLEFLKSL